MLETIITSSALIAIILLLRLVLRGKISPRVRYALWALAALRLLLPFSLSPSAVSVMNPVDTGAQMVREVIKYPAQNLLRLDFTPVSESPGTSTPGTSTPSNPAENPAAPSGEENTVAVISAPRLSVLDILKIVWLAGAAAVALRALYSNIRLALYLRKNRLPLKTQSPLPVYTVKGLPSPCLYGMSVYIPVDAAQSEETLAFVLAHEYCHYRQLDYLWSPLRAVLLAVYWFNPLVWLAARAASHDAELSCDAAAISLLGEEKRLAYGKTLIGLIPVKHGPAALCCATAMSATKSGIKERIKMLAKRPKTLLPAIIALILTLSVVAACTYTGAYTGDFTENTAGGQTETTAKNETSAEPASHPDLFPDTKNAVAKFYTLMYSLFEEQDCCKMELINRDGLSISSFNTVQNRSYFEQMISSLRNYSWAVVLSPGDEPSVFDKSAVQNGAELTLKFSSSSGESYFAFYAGSDYVLYNSSGSEYWLKTDYISDRYASDYDYGIFPFARFYFNQFEKNTAVNSIKIAYSGNDFTKIAGLYIEEYCKCLMSLTPDNTETATDYKILSYMVIDSAESNTDNFKFECSYLIRYNDSEKVIFGGPINFADDKEVGYRGTDIPQTDLHNWLKAYICFHMEKDPATGYWICAETGW